MKAGSARVRVGSSPHTRGAPSQAICNATAAGIIPAYAGSTVNLLVSHFRPSDHPRIRGEHGLSTPTRQDRSGSSPHTRGAPLNSKFPSGLCRDHPRIRGEHDTKPPARAGCRGSSPHTRGAPVRRHPAWREVRIIPAYAGSTGHDTSRSTKGQDHPRIRGEHSSPISESSSRRGSSPHTRGARGRSRPSPCPPRIIPAYAGSTTRIADLLRDSGDHPRIRGEHGIVASRCRTTAGSSPHTRGAPAPQSASGPRCRIIPAYAGSTSRSPRSSGASPDHPRIRGEHAVHQSNYSYPYRIIPAYAGSTGASRVGVPRSSDHPRIRGEHWPIVFQTLESSGSSPHTRGAHEHWVPARARRGIIPAYAGSTGHSTPAGCSAPDHPRIRGEHPHGPGSPRGARRIIPAYAGSTNPKQVRTNLSQDHPRIRGEHILGRLRVSKGLGSSPHTRGARQAILPVSSLARIIPAYAGSTPTSPSVSLTTRDHPRIRGEHFIKYGIVPSSEGSSPHTRGALDREAVAAGVDGIIPAYAGSTPRPRRRTCSSLDHPRIRGEHQLALMKPGDLVGSSPHTRGAPRHAIRETGIHGIIPAYAGSTFL